MWIIYVFFHRTQMYFSNSIIQFLILQEIFLCSLEHARKTWNGQTPVILSKLRNFYIVSTLMEKKCSFLWYWRYQFNHRAGPFWYPIVNALLIEITPRATNSKIFVASNSHVLIWLLICCILGNEKADFDLVKWFANTSS